MYQFDSITSQHDCYNRLMQMSNLKHFPVNFVGQTGINQADFKKFIVMS